MSEVWKDYFDKTKENPPRKLLMQAVGLVTQKDNALDMGSGALNDSRYLIEQKFEHVTAVDKALVAQEVADSFPKDVFEYVQSSFEEFNFPKDTFDLVNAQYALPFIKPEEFSRVFSAIKNSLRERGIFTGQLFGDRDEWAGNYNMNFHTKGEAEVLFNGMQILNFEEEEKEAPTARADMKHWHVFHFIVQK